jgi:translocator protein
LRPNAPLRNELGFPSFQFSPKMIPIIREASMGGLASKEQLRMSFIRWALVCVPATVFLGFLSGQMSNSGYDNRWFAALDKPNIIPPGWVFGAAWSVLYVLLGLVLAMLLHARGAKGRGLALGLFGAQLGLNFLWAPLYFGAHQVTLALFLILAILAIAIAATFAIAPIRKQAAYMMLPYLIWLGFASVLTFSVDRMNPDAEMMVPPTPAAEIVL